jgi:tRNA pseudouridine38-40 synthase
VSQTSPELLRARLDVAYDGAAFAGWARQPGQRTVQGELEAALGRLLREPVRLTVAGRTDAGVHARAQVAHADVPTGVDLADVQRRLASLLPADVRVRRVVPAPAGFDARFSALARRYAYRVADDPTGVDPLRRHDTVWHRRRLDVTAMRSAAAPLLGEHDFAAYCKPRPGATTVRRLLRLDVERADAVVLDVEADAFCHTMVRALVGALLAVGDGRRPVRWPAELLAARTRDSRVVVVPAHGLTLVGVTYPPDAQLAERAAQARQRREPARPPG